MVTTLTCGEHFLENLLKHRFLGLVPRDDSVGLKWGLRVCISNAPQGDGKTARAGLYCGSQASRTSFATSSNIRRGGYMYEKITVKNTDAGAMHRLRKGIIFLQSDLL